MLATAAASFADCGDWPDPGGFEAAELRECGPAAGRLLAHAAALLAAAAEEVLHEDGNPAWVGEAVTWALELARYDVDPTSLYSRLGVSPRRVTRDDIPRYHHEDLRTSAEAARERAADDPAHAPLARGAAELLDALADDAGSLPWLRRYGGGNGYDDLHVFGILALVASAPLRASLET